STVENGCLRVIPGSQRTLLETTDLGDPESAFNRGLAASEVDERRAVDLEMQPGEMVLFNEATLHASGANGSAIPRLGFLMRFTPPDLKFARERLHHPH